MFTSLRGRIVLILIVLGVSVWQIWTEGLKLGLDLQGGMHLVLEVDDPEGTMTPEARSDAIDRVERVIRSRINELGVEEPLIQKVGNERLVVELAGIRDEERAKDIIRQAAFLQFKLVLPTTEVDQVLPRIDRAVVAALGEEELRRIGAAAEVDTPQQDLESLLFGGEAGDSSAAAGGDSAAVADSAAEGGPADSASAEAPLNLRPFTALLNTGDLEGTYLVAQEDVETMRRFLALSEVDVALPRNTSLQWGSELVGRGARTYRRLYVLEEDAFMTGEALENATAGRDPQFNQAQVQFELNRAGGRRFSQFTGQHVGDYLAILLDEEVVSAPVINDRIGSRGQIDLGGAPLEEARDLALVLRAGALPVPLRIMEERTIGPSLGQDSIDQGELAGVLAIALVVLIMVGYYRVAGMLCILALGVYVVILLGFMAGIGATLTLPGIAGIILSVGMAVDANVLIFERIREEIIEGRATRTAVDGGFTQALSAIVDGNVTTLLTGLILFQFGTGPVQGFAVTLSIGIVASFFSALYVTKTFFLIYLRGKKASDPISI